MKKTVNLFGAIINKKKHSEIEQKKKRKEKQSRIVERIEFEWLSH